MDYKITIRKENEKEFLQMIHVLTDLGVVKEVEKIIYQGAEARMPERQKFEEISEKYTSDLALSEFENTYRDLVD